MAKVNIMRNDKTNTLIIGFDNVTDKDEVMEVVLQLQKDTMNCNPKMGICIISGVHGDMNGNISNDHGFLIEDRELNGQRVHAFQIQEDFSHNRMRELVNAKNTIVVLAWCFSSSWKDLNNKEIWSPDFAPYK